MEMSVSQKLDPQVAEGMDFDEEEEENTSDEAAGKMALNIFDDNDDDDDDIMAMMMDDDDDDDELQFEVPAPKVQKKSGSSSTVLVTDSALGKKKKDAPQEEEKKKRKRDADKSSFPEELRDAFNQLVEPAAFDAIYLGVEFAQDIINGKVKCETVEQKSFRDKYAKYASRRDNATSVIENYMQSRLDQILENVAKNEPFAELVGRIVDDEYERVFIKNPPKAKKGRKVRDLYTGDITDEPRPNKDQRYVFLQLKGGDGRYDGYYVDTQGANIIQLVTMYKFFYIYLRRVLQDTFTAEQREAAANIGDQKWSALYSNITQEFSEKPVHKWTKKKDIIKTGSFVDIVIKAKRTLEALAE